MDLVSIGRIVKRFGVRGFVKAVSGPPFFETFASCRAIFVNLDGSMVPFLIEERQDGPEEWSIKLKRIDSPEEARLIVGKEVFVERHHIVGKLSQDAPEDLSGYVIRHTYGSDLKIEGVETYPQQIMLKCAKNEGQPILIPLVEEWVVSVDPESKVIVMELPDGII